MSTDCVDDLLAEYGRYDRYVDVVSVFEALYRHSEALPPTVHHFERYPTIAVGDGRTLTPDWSVLFEDGTGLVGEISTIARLDESVDDLCDQIGQYDRLPAVPANSDGVLADVSHVDVVCMVPLADGTTAAERVLARMVDPDHPYSPSHPPTICQFTFDRDLRQDRYVFQRVLHPENGYPREHSRIGIGEWLSKNTIKVPPKFFEPVKVESAFMNDPIDPLYLAVHLWSQLFPTLVESEAEAPHRLDVSVSMVADTLLERYGKGSRSDVRSALSLLSNARLGEDIAEDSYVFAWEQLRASEQEHDLAITLANRICEPPASGPLDRLVDEVADDDETEGDDRLQVRLFDHL